MSESKTPRTDAKEYEVREQHIETQNHYGWKFARQLETEHAELVAALEAILQRVDETEMSYESAYGLLKRGPWHIARAALAKARA